MVIKWYSVQTLFRHDLLLPYSCSNSRMGWYDENNTHTENRKQLLRSNEKKARPTWTKLDGRSSPPHAASFFALQFLSYMYNNIASLLTFSVWLALFFCCYLFNSAIYCTLTFSCICCCSWIVSLLITSTVIIHLFDPFTPSRKNAWIEANERGAGMEAVYAFFTSLHSHSLPLHVVYGSLFRHFSKT